MSIKTAKPQLPYDKNYGKRFIYEATLNLYERTLQVKLKTVTLGGAVVDSEISVPNIDDFDLAAFSGFSVTPQGQEIKLGGKSFGIEDICAVAGIPIPDEENYFDSQTSLRQKEQMKKMLSADMNALKANPNAFNTMPSLENSKPSWQLNRPRPTSQVPTPPQVEVKTNISAKSSFPLFAVGVVVFVALTALLAFVVFK